MRAPPATHSIWGLGWSIIMAMLFGPMEWLCAIICAWNVMANKKSYIVPHMLIGGIDWLV